MHVQLYADEMNADNYFFIDNMSQNAVFNQYKLCTILEGSLRIFFPFSEELTALSFVNVGYGLNYNIINNLISPGISLDLSIGTDWFWLFGSNNNTYDTSKRTQFAFAGGVKIYNMIKIYDLMIIPFVGCNFMFFSSVFPMIGLSISFKNFGLEYAYYFKIGSYKPEVNHHISFKFLEFDYWASSSRRSSNY